MPSFATQMRGYANRYNTVLDVARILNDEHQPAQKGVLRLALSNTAITHDASKLDQQIKAMQRPIDNLDAGEKTRVLWFAYAGNAFGKMYDDDVAAPAFNERYYVKPMRDLVRSLSDQEKITLRAQMARDIGAKEFDLTPQDGLDEVFSTDPDRSFSLDQTTEEQPIPA